MEPITLTPKQARFHSEIFNSKGRVRSDNPYCEFAYFGGFGSGKSMISMLATYQICLIYPGTQWLYARSTYPELHDSVIPQFIELTKEEGFTHKKIDRNAIFANGSVIYFRAYDRDTKILSNQYHGATFCQAEEMAYEMYLQTLGRLRLKGNGIPKNIIIMEGNPAAGWCKDRFKNNPLPKDTFFIEATTRDNPYVSEEYIRRMEDNYPKHWVRRFIYGEWENTEEMVFSEFREKHHVIDAISIPDSYQKVIGMDYGWVNPSAMVWLAVDYDGRVHVFDEFKEAKQTVNLLNFHASRHGTILTVIDYSTKTKTHHGDSVYDDLAASGIPLTESNKDKQANILLVNQLFKQGKLLIHSNCTEIIKEITNYKWKRPKLGADSNLPEEVIKKDDHLMDALMYGVRYLKDVNSVDPSIAPYHMTIDGLVKRQSIPEWEEDD